MSGDKRSVATDALEVLGMVIPENKEVGRDAIHLACLPGVVADDYILPGAHAGLTFDGKISAKPGVLFVGIVDPFVRVPVVKGQRVLLVIYPRTIESLRHVWSHPNIPEEADYDPDRELRAKLEAFGRTLDPPVSADQLYDAMSENADRTYVTVYGTDAYGQISIPKECWDLYAKIHGERASPDPWNEGEGVYFSCSC